MTLIQEGADALNAVVLAVKVLELDPRFNAGIGSQIRCDGLTVQMDASCMKDNGEFGAVAVIENVTNPILVAQKVMEESSNIMLAGKGAEDFARLHKLVSQESITASVSDSGCDTVGAIAFDGKHFAAALSSGGLAKADLGRVGDVPLPGCGLFCGPSGAVACTGDGEFIARKLLAREVYSWIDQGMEPEQAAKKAVALFDKTIDIGLIVVTKTNFGICSQHTMASAYLLETEV